MQCLEFADRLLDDELDQSSEVAEHIAGCARCSRLARGLERLDGVLRSNLVVEPPLELQRRLALVAFEAARPQASIKPWWARALEIAGQLNLSAWLAQQPQMIAAQGLAAVMLALASWQVLGWLSAVRPVVGDVAYAMELVAGSPAVAYLGSMQIDLQSLGIWSLVGAAGWLISENGPVGRRFTSSRLQLP